MRYLTLILLLWSSLNAQNREALLIGNSHYQFISNLNDTSSNLSHLKSALKGLNFNVIIKNDLNSKKLKQAIDEFQERLARSHETIGFLYYSGHGCQLDNVGYLVPTNVNTKKKLDIKYDAMNIDKMLETLDSAGNRVNMLFLDACRDVPTNVKGSTKGLGQAPQRPKGTLLVYATEAGKTAEDNSKFINALISNINKPNKNIRDIAYDISNEVADKTGEGQIPEVFAKRLPEVVLKRGGGEEQLVYVPPVVVVEPKPVVVIPVPKPISTFKWISPTNNICKANGGKIDDGVCHRVSWKDAIKICKASGGSLPTKEDLHKIITDCGGVLNTNVNFDREFYKNKNINNSNYQVCYKKKGFDNKDYYWTSETYKESSSYAWSVLFQNGHANWGNKNFHLSVVCTK